MKYKQEKPQGITLIALVITIIVLLILAAVSVVTLTGQNGLLNKAEIARRNTNIEETKERIKLELAGAINEENTNYTNQDVIKAIEKITGNKVEENAPVVKSDKGNDIDISDFWIKEEIKEDTKYYFTINGIKCYFTDKDAGFTYNSSGDAMFYFDEWLNHHVSEVSCTKLWDETCQVLDKGEMVDMIDYHTLRKEGSVLYITIQDLEKRIYYE